MDIVEQDNSDTDISDTEYGDVFSTQDMPQALESSMAIQGNERKKVACDICGEAVFPRNFKRHMLRHEDVKLKCKICSKLFPNETKLGHHERNHVELSNTVQVCNYCGKKYKRKSGVIEHIRLVHESNTNRSFSCTVCGKLFTRLGHLQNHMNTHCDQKPFTCLRCGRGYNSQTSLNFHEKMCEIEKKYKCRKCPREFNSRVSLNEHKQSEHEQRRYSCMWCGVVFKWRPSLYRHKKTCLVANQHQSWSNVKEDTEDNSNK